MVNEGKALLESLTVHPELENSLGQKRTSRAQISNPENEVLAPETGNSFPEN